jgi:uncharacterized membrane protein HdeD (DUF308 family)
MFPMFQLMTRYLWVFSARGVLAILYGLFLFMSTDLSLYSFVIAAGLFVLLESLLLLPLIFGRHAEKILMVSIESGVGACIGVVILFGSTLGSLLIPSVTSVMVPIYIGSWAISTGVFGLIHTVMLKSQMQGLWVLVLSSLLVLLFGVWIIFHGNEGALSLQWMIAAFAILFGVLHLGVVLKAKIYAAKA